MLAAMLTAAGFRAARYMSPHVTDIRERICLGDSFFGEEVYCAAGDELRHITEMLLPAAANAQTAALFDSASGCEPTFWELLTLLFFLCAKHGNCDVMVVETGMGGRLDSTNVLDPLVSVITMIELEHTSFLGSTIAAVAGEKAGIIKQDRPLILAKQKEEALDVFRKKAEEKNSRFFYFPEIADLSCIKVSPQGTDFTLSLKKPLSSSPLDLSIPLPGKVQAENAAIAVAALETAFPQIFAANSGEDVIRRGLKNLNIPARFEKIAEIKTAGRGICQPFIIDGAHTPESLALCVETFCSLYGEGGVLIFGCAADKDASAMAKEAYSRFEKIIITTPGTFKISNPSLVYKVFACCAVNDGSDREKTVLVENTFEAVRLAMDFAALNGLPVLGTGSFYLVSEIRKMV
jgi:dihydrofolate synthase/folylpolyglutamate synthase